MKLWRAITTYDLKGHGTLKTIRVKLSLCNYLNAYRIKKYFGWDNWRIILFIYVDIPLL